MPPEADAPAAADASAAGDVSVRDVDGAAQASACAQLYARVMGLRPDDGSINPRLMIALQANSGYVLGAFDGPELIGFAYSFLARDRSSAQLYQYSQLAVVARERQGAGVGRALKHAQRERCLADGVTLMRWAFDPLKARNAHFNLDVIAGRLVRFVPSMYGAHGFGTDTGHDTDRFIVEWDLTRAARTVATTDADVLITVPADWTRHAATVGTAAAASQRGELMQAFSRALDDGLVGVSCLRVSQDAFAYRFTPPTGAAS